MYRPKLLLLSPLFFMIQKIPPAVWIHGYKSSKYPEIWFVSHFQRKNRIEILLINYSWAYYDVNTSWEIPTACVQKPATTNLWMKQIIFIVRDQLSEIPNKA